MADVNVTVALLFCDWFAHSCLYRDEVCLNIFIGLLITSFFPLQITPPINFFQFLIVVLYVKFIILTI